MDPLAMELESQTFTTLRPDLPNRSAPSTNQRQIYATERAKILFGGYRRGDANDPETYVASIAAVLSCYEPDVIREATDPRTGISTQEKFLAFMPNSGELKAFCDAIANHRQRMARYAALPPPQRVALPRPGPQPGCRAVCFVPSTNGRYQQVFEATKAADPLDWKYDHERTGIWISIPMYQKIFRR